LQDIVVVTLSSLLAVETTYIAYASPLTANLSLEPAYPFCSPVVQNITLT